MHQLTFTNCQVMPDARTPFDSALCDILVEDDRIAAVVPAGKLPSVGQRYDMSGFLAAPGLINGHIHSWDQFIKGRIENLPMELMMPYFRPRNPPQLTDRQVYLRTMLGIIESLRTGATTMVDDMSLGQRCNRGHAEAALQAYEDAGIRAYLGFSMMDKAIVDSWPYVEECFDPELLASLRALPRPSADELFGLMGDLVKTHHPASRRVGVIMAPSAPQRCTEDFLRTCRRLADEWDLPTIIHVLETRLQVVTARQLYGGTMIDYLDRIGFLAPRTSLIHAVWLTESDREIIARSGATVQYNPFSNAVLGSGMADLQALQRAGVNVSMGSDGCGVLFTVSMPTSLKFGVCLPRLRTPDTTRWPNAQDVWEAATVGGARALGREADLGRIAPGFKADMVFYRLDCTALMPLNHPARQLVHGDTGGAVDTVVVDGRLVLQHGRLTQVPEQRILAEFEETNREIRDAVLSSEEDSRPVFEGVARIYARAGLDPLAPGTTQGFMEE